MNFFQMAPRNCLIVSSVRGKRFLSRWKRISISNYIIFPFLGRQYSRRPEIDACARGGTMMGPIQCFKVRRYDSST